MYCKKINLVHQISIIITEIDHCAQSCAPVKKLGKGGGVIIVQWDEWWIGAFHVACSLHTIQTNKIAVKYQINHSQPRNQQQFWTLCR